ncbi:MAG: hypothetical protein FWC60_01720 [Firmicutes bacterium]|nr:hypothetical protein [Bacillota bacterium]
MASKFPCTEAGLFQQVTGQTLRLLLPVAQARKVINRKRFLEEYERTVNNFTGRLDAVQ